MSSVTMTIALLFVSRLHAKGQSSDSSDATDSMERLVDNLLDNTLEQVLRHWSLHNAVLDRTMLAVIDPGKIHPVHSLGTLGARRLPHQLPARPSLLDNPHSTFPVAFPHVTSTANSMYSDSGGTGPIRPEPRREHAVTKALSTFQSAGAKYEESLDTLYKKSFNIKCPFLRRRSLDGIEAAKRVLLFIFARHKSTPIFPSPRTHAHVNKIEHLPLDEIAAIIQKDWIGKGGGKGYYITGKLTEEIYDEECLFDGPDPDMPVKGLRKYLLAASQLFDTRRSRADLIRPIEYDAEKSSITAYWRLQGVINLPWHPPFKPWTGSTTYHIDPDSGLVSSHREDWDISVPDAFISTLFPELNFGAPAAEPVDHLVIEPPCPVGQSINT